MALTDVQIKNLKNSGKPMKLADGGGLYIYLAASGKKLWRLGYYFERKAKVLSFGEYPIVTRQRAMEKRMEVTCPGKTGPGPMLGVLRPQEVFHGQEEARS